MSTTPVMQNFLQPDLAELASQQFLTAHQCCEDCQAYHALWPYLRLTHQVGGVEADQAYLTPLLNALLGSQPRRILIAGSADTGVTALVHHAAGSMARHHEITVVDRCETPLTACRQYGAAHGLKVRTLQTDLRHLAMRESIDVIVGHSVLPFLDANGRHTALCALYDALAAQGRMVLTTRLAAPGQTPNVSSAHASDWANKLKVAMLDSLKQQVLALPCSLDSLDALLQDFTRGPNGTSSSATQTQLQNELSAAGFQIERWIHSGKGMAMLDNGQIQTQARQGLVAVTTAKQVAHVTAVS